MEKEEKKDKKYKISKTLITLELMKTTLRPTFGGIIETYPKLRLFFYSGVSYKLYFSRFHITQQLLYTFFFTERNFLQ